MKRLEARAPAWLGIGIGLGLGLGIGFGFGLGLEAGSLTEVSEVGVREGAQRVDPLSLAVEVWAVT